MFMGAFKTKQQPIRVSYAREGQAEPPTIILKLDSHRVRNVPEITGVRRMPYGCGNLSIVSHPNNSEHVKVCVIVGVRGDPRRAKKDSCSVYASLFSAGNEKPWLTVPPCEVFEARPNPSGSLFIRFNDPTHRKDHGFFWTAFFNVREEPDEKTGEARFWLRMTGLESGSLHRSGYGHPVFIQLTESLVP